MACARTGVSALGLFLLAHAVCGARVQHIEELAEPSDAGVEPSFRLAGVPVYGAEPEARMRLAPGAARPKRDWVVMLKRDSTDSEVHSLCADGGGEQEEEGRGGCLEGHPTQGGVPFAEVSLSDSDLEALLQKHPGRVQFVEADAEIWLDPELPVDDFGLGDGGSLGDIQGDPGDPGGAALVQTGAGGGDAAAAPWGIRRIGSQTRGEGKGAHVYVIDTGVRVSHHEFGGRAIPTLDMTGGALKECDPQDLTCAADGLEKGGHGTHCAATVGGETTGVASGATIHAVKVFGDDGKSHNSWIYGALDWIIRKGQKPAVASMSLGAEGQSVGYKRAIDAAVSAGITVVVAAGNQNVDACTRSPAFVAKAIAVGATTLADERSGFSNFGSCVNMFAPGSNIVAAAHTSDSGLTTKSGTSMACPHVAGAAARLLSKNPSMTPNDIMKEFQRSGEAAAIGDARGSANYMLIVDPAAVERDEECPDILTLSGSTQWQKSRMGEYTKTSLMQEGRPIYRGSGRNLIYSLEGWWRIGGDISKKSCFIYTNRGERCPNQVSPGGWIAWTGSTWERVGGLKAQPGQGCPDAVLVSGEFTTQKAGAGRYEKTHLTQEHRPVYRSASSGLYLYFLGGYWMIHRDHTTKNSYVYAKQDVSCPTMVSEGQWLFYDGTKFQNDPSIRVSGA